MSLFWKKMKALFLQTKICEASQIRINMNHLCLVVNKRLLRVETSNQMWWRKQFGVQLPISIFNFSMWHSIIPMETTTSFTRHIIVCDAVAFPNQVVGGRESLLNKGNFFTHPVSHSHPKIGESSGALTLSIKSLRVNVWQWWNHGPSNAPKISSAGTTTGFGFDPRQCNYWKQKGNQ